MRTRGYETASELPIWLGVLGGPLFWGAHLGIGYILVTLPCIFDIEMPRVILYALTAVAAGGALACTAASGLAWRGSGVRLREDWGESGGRKGFMAALGVMFSSISFFSIVVQSLALPFASFCGIGGE